MKTLVIYDSTYGNTEKIAQAVGAAIEGKVLNVSEVILAEVKVTDLLIIGSPTHGGWYTEAILNLLKASPDLEGVNTAVFDTRTKKSIFGFAAPRMARSIEKNGGKLIAPPEGFIVLGVHGPLKDGEIERSAGWATKLLERSDVNVL